MKRCLEQLKSKVSDISIEEMEASELIDISYKNSSVKEVVHLEKGIHFFEPKNPVDDEVMILSAGLHGDEMAGIEVIDKLRADICSGNIRLRKNVLFVDGNLKAMQQAKVQKANGHSLEARSWGGDDEFGVEANANRQWLLENLEKDQKFKSYAGRRRVQIWQALMDLLKAGGDGGNIRTKIMHLDLHQSIKAPKVKEVRGSYHNNSEYTYAMVYNSLEMFRKKYGEVFAGLVISDPETAETFAGITARELGAQSGTVELGTIGSPKQFTYADKMLKNLKHELEGVPRELKDLVIDIWTQERTIIKDYEDFGFHGSQGRIKEPITDFVPIDEELWVFNGQEEDSDTFIIDSGTSLLFANRDVSVGDRAGIIIKKK